MFLFWNVYSVNLTFIFFNIFPNNFFACGCALKSIFTWFLLTVKICIIFGIVVMLMCQRYLEMISVLQRTASWGANLYFRHFTHFKMNLKQKPKNWKNRPTRIIQTVCKFFWNWKFSERKLNEIYWVREKNSQFLSLNPYEHQKFK